MRLILCGLLGHRMRRQGTAWWKRCTRCGHWQGVADLLTTPAPPEIKAVIEDGRRRRTPSRRAGGRWRILVHEYLGKASETGLLYGRAYHVSSSRDAEVRAAKKARQLREIKPDADPSHDSTSYITLEGTEFDELVIGSWIHLEQMDTGVWWMNIGGVTVNIKADRDGRPKRIDVYGPGDYADAAEGCAYYLEWSAPLS